MSSATWVCFECRETVRRSRYTRAAVRCPSCGHSCRYVGHKLRIPPKTQPKAWQKLRDELQQEAIARVDSEPLIRLQNRRALQAEIDRLEARGPNEGRARQVRLLRRRLEKL